MVNRPDAVFKSKICPMYLFKIIVGVWYIMWSNIGKVEEHKNSMEFLPSPRRSFDSGTGKPTNDALYINADCHSSVKGIFMGIFK